MAVELQRPVVAWRLRSDALKGVAAWFGIEAGVRREADLPIGESWVDSRSWRLCGRFSIFD
jgi:hypothetical protein